MYIENLVTSVCHYIAPFNLTGDLLTDSDNIRQVIDYPFNLYADESMAELLATSEI